MIQYSVRNKATGKITNQWNSNQHDENYYEPSFGKPDRWIHEDDLSSAGEVKENATASEEIGGLDAEKKRYFFPAEYTIEASDISQNIQQLEINEEALKVLANTDWYVIRFAETGVAIPQVVLEARANARAAIVRE